MTITITTEDHETGETETVELKPDSYVLTCGERIEFVHEQLYANGTRIITLKRKGASS